MGASIKVNGARFYNTQEKAMEESLRDFSRGKIGNKIFSGVLENEGECFYSIIFSDETPAEISLKNGVMEWKKAKDFQAAYDLHGSEAICITNEEFEF